MLKYVIYQYQEVKVVAKELKDTYISLRVSKQLKHQIQEIAEETNRSLNNAAELLLIRAVQQYQIDRYLIDTRPQLERKSA
jgi:hypothetical protein